MNSYKSTIFSCRSEKWWWNRSDAPCQADTVGTRFDAYLFWRIRLRHLWKKGGVYGCGMRKLCCCWLDEKFRRTILQTQFWKRSSSPLSLWYEQESLSFDVSGLDGWFPESLSYLVSVTLTLLDRTEPGWVGLGDSLSIRLELVSEPLFGRKQTRDRSYHVSQLWPNQQLSQAGECKSTRQV